MVSSLATTVWRCGQALGGRCEQLLHVWEALPPACPVPSQVSKVSQLWDGGAHYKCLQTTLNTSYRGRKPNNRPIRRVVDDFSEESGVLNHISAEPGQPLLVDVKLWKSLTILHLCLTDARADLARSVRWVFVEVLKSSTMNIFRRTYIGVLISGNDCVL